MEFCLKDLGIGFDDIDVTLTGLPEGGADFEFFLSEEAGEILRAFCEREGISQEELATAMSRNFKEELLGTAPSNWRQRVWEQLFI